VSEAKRVGPYPAEVRERAVRMVFDHEHEYPSQCKAIEWISKKLNLTTIRCGCGVRKA
jgi:hypothetical protein